MSWAWAEPAEGWLGMDMAGPWAGTDVVWLGHVLDRL
jgi:hypothetical protein